MRGNSTDFRIAHATENAHCRVIYTNLRCFVHKFAERVSKMMNAECRIVCEHVMCLVIFGGTKTKKKTKQRPAYIKCVSICAQVCLACKWIRCFCVGNTIRIYTQRSLNVSNIF